jgi:photosystem II stability/assembly factor-like uncharacterized protein
LVAIAAPSASTAWILELTNSGTDVIRTNDGGSTWVRQPAILPNSSFFGNAIGSSPDGQTAWVADRSGRIARTTDAAQTWTEQISGTRTWLSSASALSPSVAWVVGDAGTVLHTEDAGATWALQTSGVTQNLRSVAGVSSSAAWAVGDAGVILRTDDGGATWKRQTSGATGNLWTIAARSALEAWVFGDGGILATHDGGLTWQPQSADTSSVLRGGAVVNEVAFAVGDGGTILKGTAR